MACTPCQYLFTLIMENENTYYLLGYDQDMVEETLTLLAEGEKCCVFRIKGQEHSN